MDNFEPEIRQVREALRDVTVAEATSRADADKVRDEVRASGVNVATDKAAFEKLDAAYRDADAKRDEITELRNREAALLRRVGERADAPKPSVERNEARSIATQLIESAEYRALVASGRLKNGSSRVDTQPIEVMSRDAAVDLLRQRTNIDNSSGEGGGVIWSDRLENLIIAKPSRKPRLLDYVTVGTTDTDTVEWVDETTVSDAAAETAYGSSAPQANYGYTKTSTTVKRVTQFVAATKGAIADSAQLATLINSRSVRGVNLRVESQLINGDGTGENLTGVLHTSNILTQVLGADSHADSVHKAITQVRVNLLDQGDANAIGISPNDYEKLVLEKDANGNYTNGRPATEAPFQTIWGLTPIVSTLFADGSPWVADWTWLYVWVRSGIEVSMSDSHASFFIQGLVAILAEMRVAAAVTQPLAFCEMTGF